LSKDYDINNSHFVFNVFLSPQGYKHRNAYIASQAPLRNTVNDLWRMIWEFKSKTIVMLCNFEERGEESSANYWPHKENEVTQYGKINVTLQSKASYGDFTVRKFQVQEDRVSVNGPLGLCYVCVHGKLGHYEFIIKCFIFHSLLELKQWMGSLLPSSTKLSGLLMADPIQGLLLRCLI